MQQASKMLINEEPVVFQATLAKTLGGVPEAVFVQQLHYRLRVSTNFHDGRHWVYKTIPEWVDELHGLWVDKTIKRAISKLKAAGVLLIGNYNKLGFDNTNWYSLDYARLQELETQCPDDGDKLSPRSGHDVPKGEDNKSQGEGQNVPVRPGQNVPTNTKELKNTPKEDQRSPTTTDAQAHEVIWKRCLQEIEPKISVPSFSSWIQPLRAVSYEDKVLVLACKEEFHREWVESRYTPIIKDTLKELAKAEIAVRIIVRPPEEEGELPW